MPHLSKRKSRWVSSHTAAREPDVPSPELSLPIPIVEWFRYNAVQRDAISKPTLKSKMTCIKNKNMSSHDVVLDQAWGITKMFTTASAAEHVHVLNAPPRCVGIRFPPCGSKDLTLEPMFYNLAYLVYSS